MQRYSECVSEFPLMSRQGRDMEEVGFRRRWFTGDVVGHTRHYMDGMCPELWGGVFCQRSWSIEVSPYRT